MAAVTVLLPFVIIAFFGVFFFFAFRVGKKYMTIKVTHWLLFIYIGVLVIATITVALIPKDEYKRENDDVENMDRIINEELNEIYSLLRKGDLTKLNSAYLKKEDDFPLDSNEKLLIDFRGDYHPQIFIEKKQANDDQIEAYVYTSRVLVSGIDVTELVEPYHIRMYDESLVITPVFQKLNLAIVSENFAVRQFTGDTLFDHSYNGSEQIVYLRVPQGLEIEVRNLYLEYVELKK